MYIHVYIYIEYTCGPSCRATRLYVGSFDPGSQVAGKHLGAKGMLTDGFLSPAAFIQFCCCAAPTHAMHGRLVLWTAKPQTFDQHH